MTAPHRIPGHRFLHSPGPTRVPEAVQHAMSQQPMDLGDPRVDELIRDCEQGLKGLMNAGAANVFLYAANGHGAWEAVVSNIAAPGQAVLVAGTGHFSESWAVQTETLGVRVVRTPWREGESIDAAAITDALRADVKREIVAVFVVHTDTASGVTSELAPLRQAIDDAGHPALFVVDVVASLAATPFDMQALRANVVLGASQKGLMVPPGLAFVAADEQAMAVAQRNRTPRFYWDWTLRANDLSYRKFCGTPPHALLMGLRAALGLISSEGLANVFARHRLLAGALQAAVQGWSQAGTLDFFARQAAARSVSVTTIKVAAGFDPEALRTLARERFQVAMAGGLGPLAGRVFRIGHLGDLNPAMVLGCLGGIEAAMQVLKLPHGPGLAHAVAYLAAGSEALAPGPAQ